VKLKSKVLFWACIASVWGSPALASDDAVQDHHPVLVEENGLYTEGWDQLFYFPDGTLIIGQFTVTNLGIGDHNAGVLGVIYPPKGEPVVLKKSRRWEHWSFSKKELDITVAEHRLKGRRPDYKLQIHKASGELDLDFSATSVPWRIGRTVQSEQGYQYVSFYAPLARARVRYRVAGPNDELGEWRELRDGHGFALRYLNTVSADELFSSATRIVPLGTKGPLPVFYLINPRQQVPMVHAMLFDKGKTVATLAAPNLVPRSVARLTNNVPAVIPIDVSMDNVRLTGTIKVDRLLGQLDPVDLLKPYVRIFVRLFNTPINYRYLANYDLIYVRNGRSQRLTGRALVDHMVVKRDGRENGEQ